MVDLLQQDDSIYYAETSNDTDKGTNAEPISEDVVQKSGYLNLRS